VNTPRTVSQDPQFVARTPWARESGTDLLPTPIRFPDEDPVALDPAPRLGADTEAVLREVAGYTDDQLATLRSSGALGEPG
jgi:crotonobetainyl-CoA:carnitine CoA-transferase CaiB-like acyl-CoA transferase